MGDDTLMQNNKEPADPSRSLDAGEHAAAVFQSRDDNFRKMAEVTAAGILTHQNGRIIYANPAMQRLTGYSLAQLESMAPVDLVHPEDRPLFLGSVTEQLGGAKGERSYEVRILRPNGELRWAEISAASLDSPDGPIVCGTAHDITALRQAEEEVRRREATFGALLEHSWEGIALLSAAGRIKGVSPSMATILGQAHDELIGTSVRDRVHPDDLNRVGPVWAELSRDYGKTVTTEFRVKHKSGGWRFIEATVTNLLKTAAVRAVVANCRDVSERRRLEEQFNHAQKMESVGRLAGGVAHDFNNLLTVISSSIDMALFDLPAEHVVRVDLLEARRAARRAANLTKQLLTFARRQNTQPRVVELSALIAETTVLLRRLISEDIELKVASSQASLTIRVDPGQIEQVLANLAVNARDAMSNGGCLSISSTRLLLDSSYSSELPDSPAGDYAMLTVEDNGCGMSPEVMLHVFEPFFTTKESGKGTGLGLATCYGIVRQNGGHIYVDSELGKGTRFRILLPFVDEEVADDAPSSRRLSLPVHGGTETILVVEDEPQVRALAARVLRARRYSVLEASCGDEALKLVETFGVHRIDLLLTDVIMPGMNGKELSLRLRALKPSIHVVFMSGYTDQVPVQNDGDSVDGFVQKPFAPDHLIAAIRENLQGLS